MFNYAIDNRQLAHHAYTTTALILHSWAAINPTAHNAAQPVTHGTIFYCPIHDRRSVDTFGKTSNYQTNLDPCNPLFPEVL